MSVLLWHEGSQTMCPLVPITRCHPESYRMAQENHTYGSLEAPQPHGVVAQGRAVARALGRTPQFDLYSIKDWRRRNELLVRQGQILPNVDDLCVRPSCAVLWKTVGRSGADSGQLVASECKLMTWLYCNWNSCEESILGHNTWKAFVPLLAWR